MKRTALLLISLALVSGCTAETEDKSGMPAPEALQQGLTVLEARPGVSVTAAFKKLDVVIYFEAVRGQPTPEMYQKDDASPKYEVDARFLADNGRTFWVQRGGDHFVDPDWAIDLEREQTMPPTRVSNRLLFEMAAEAVADFSDEVAAHVGVDQVAELDPEISALTRIGNQAPATFAKMTAHAKAHSVEKGELLREEVAYGSAGPESPDYAAGAGYYYLGLYDSYLGGDGWHTATRLNRWTGSAWATAFDACNHGGCPVTGTNLDCIFQYTEVVNDGDYKPAFTHWSCNTPYDMTSDDGGHNCHDDSRLQMASFVYGNGHQKDPGNKYWCNGNDDSTDISTWGAFDQNGTPECDSSSDQGYRHPHTCRGQGTHGYNSAAGCYCDAACLTYNDCCIDGPY